MRSFVAVEFDDGLQQRLADFGQRLSQRVGRGARAPAAATIHLTLRFLGEWQEQQLEAIGDALAAQLRGCAGCRIELGGLGAFPHPGRARVVWLGVEPVPAQLRRLKQLLDAALEPWLEPERREFTPHVTLLRLRQPRRVEIGQLSVLAPAEPLTAPIEGLSLMRSELLPGGARHSRLRWLPLAPVAGEA